MSTILAISTLDVVDMLLMKACNVIALPDGALTMDNEADRTIISTLKGVGLNLEALLREALHLL